MLNIEDWILTMQSKNHNQLCPPLNLPTILGTKTAPFFAVFSSGSYRCLGIDAGGIQQNVLGFDSQLQGHAAHGFRLVNLSITRSAGKDELPRLASSIKLAGRAHAIGQGIRGPSVLISASAEN